MKVDLDTLSKKFYFCMLCKGKLKLKGKNILLCTDCGYEHFINPAPANAAILINKNNELLLVKRKYEPKKGYWDLPGGFIDVNETAEESIIRELNEELQTDIQNLTYLGSFYDVYIYQDIEIPTIVFVYNGVVDIENLEPADDVQEIKFFPFKDIPYSLLAFDNVSKSLNEYLKK